VTERVIRTKLFVPPLGPNLVSRPRLTGQLDQALDSGCCLVLLSAPAGFGKTTLVSEWVVHSDLAYTWLSLDKADNDPLRFLTYLVAAMQMIIPGIGIDVLNELRAPGVALGSRPAQIESALTILINEVTQVQEHFIVVLDDYHAIEAPAVHAAVSFLLEHMPTQMHLVIASRIDPPLTIARLRGQGQLAEIHATDLGFALDEATIFLREAMDLDLSASQVSALEKRTEGWIAGLQLAALSIRGCGDASDFIQAFTGSHRYILDYLTEEVLSHQSEDIQSFLKQTSILNRLSGSLCDAVAEREDSQKMLETLEAANLFIIPLDEERRWYRYHHLFADLLRQHLQREKGDLLPGLHRRASEWYEKNGQIPEAVDHALAAQEFERAADLVERTAWALLTRGELATVLGWISGLPYELMHTRARLAFFHSWAMDHSGEVDRVEECLTGVDLREVAGEVATVRAHVAAVRGNTAQSIALAQEATRQLPADNLFLRGLVAQTLGLAHHWGGNPGAAAQALTQAIELSRAAGQTTLTVTALAFLGRALVVQGKLRQAVDTYQEVLELVVPQISRPVPYASIAYVGIAGALYEWNDLDGALRYAKEGIKRSQASGFIPYQLVGNIFSARVHLARGDLPQALESFHQAEYLEQNCDYAYVNALLDELRIRLWVARENLAAAEEWVQAHWSRQVDDISLAQELEQITVAGALIKQSSSANNNAANDIGKALNLLSHLLEKAESAGRLPNMIKIMVLQALALQTCGDNIRALSTLEQALSLAEPECFRRTFLDEGESMSRLLYQARQQKIMPEFSASLISASNASSQFSAEGLVEPLSEREFEVLRLIAAGLSNQEIAQELVIAVSTVKSHINHIYGKLGVRSRTQAVARAQSLGLLSIQA